MYFKSCLLVVMPIISVNENQLLPSNVYQRVRANVFLQSLHCKCTPFRHLSANEHSDKASQSKDTNDSRAEYVSSNANKKHFPIQPAIRIVFNVSVLVK